MKIRKNGEENEMNISMNNRRMKEDESYRYLGVDISSDGNIDEDVNHNSRGVESMGSTERLVEKSSYF